MEDGSASSISTAAFLSSAAPSLYVSCIKVDGRPILPPVMTEEKRAEMRQYRAIAVSRQKEREKIRDYEEFASSVENSNCNDDLEDGRPLTSTPMKLAQKEIVERPSNDNSACSSDLENLPKSSSSSASSQEEEEGSSASTGTFIIHRKSQQPEITSFQQTIRPDDMESDVDGGPLSPSAMVFSKRKRPAKYFDTKDEEQVVRDIPQQQDKQINNSIDDSSFASTNLSKYITGCGGTSYSSLSNITTPGETCSNRCFSQMLPNSVPEEEKEKPSSSSSCEGPGPDHISFTINTDFLSLSKLSLEDKDKRSPPLKAVRRSGRKKFFESPEPTHETPDDHDNDNDEDGSDKENIQDRLENKTLTSITTSASKSHVRKLSYTLNEPSEALLTAGLRSPPSGEATERYPLSPIPQSAPSTPNVKTYAGQTNTNPSTQSFQWEGKEIADDNNEDLRDGRNSPELGKGEALEKLEELMSRYEQEALRMKSLFEAEKVKILQEIGQVKGNQIEQRLIEQEQKKKNSPAPVVLDLSKKKSKDKLPLTSLTGESHLYHHEHQYSSSTSAALSETNNLRNFFCPFSNTSPESPPSRSTATFDFNSHAAPSAASPRVTSSGLALLQSIRGQKRQSTKPVNLPDAASPLLKGLVIPPEEIRQTPKQPLKSDPSSIKVDEVLNKKLCKIGAAAKGFLVRRILHTERVQGVVATIRDTLALLLSLYEEHKLTGKGTPDDELHRRLLQQLTSACTSFHDVFFKLTTRERMAIIANDREKLKAKALNMKLSTSHSGSRKLSEATMKSLERRLTLDKSPTKSKTSSKTFRRKTTTSSRDMSHRFTHRPSFASNSNSININNSSSTSISSDIRGAMKRRRLSTAATFATSGRDTNGNSLNNKRPSTTTGALTFDRAHPTTTVTPREFLSARQHVDPSWGSTTFVIPSSHRVPASKIPSNSNNPRLSSRMSVSSTNSTPSSRAPWKKH